MRSPDFRAFTRLSCVHQTFVRSPDYSCVHDQTFVRSPDYSCVHDQTFVRSPDYSCVHDQTFVRFSLFPDHVNLNARHPRRAFIWVWTYRLSVWDLNLGSFKSYIKSDSFTKSHQPYKTETRRESGLFSHNLMSIYLLICSQSSLLRSSAFMEKRFL